eukprot:TRINITY_DN36472_c1_g1_i1.p1 TRINITY_DN36472_c1_g1~~TRINITY_DN36472_c1_g1_i1.p1  ORF type:complete len:477 (-),score=81.70 TRINITY_DN36472_c1_g1_i1:417-1847(-)
MSNGAKDVMLSRALLLIAAVGVCRCAVSTLAFAAARAGGESACNYFRDSGPDRNGEQTSSAHWQQSSSVAQGEPPLRWILALAGVGGALVLAAGRRTCKTFAGRTLTGSMGDAQAKLAGEVGSVTALAAKKGSLLGGLFAQEPPSVGASPWHTVGLYVTSWSGRPTDLLRYVNEMPRGSLLKFEVQPGSDMNAILEDPKGSARLAAFGQPVPFNYGCFPQTYRDPQKACKVYGAPGDDDPLDVLDLTMDPVGVGEVVQCRPLGAVCLIDEGQADWKVLVVNTEADDPLAQASSVDDVERIAPGRIAECLKWIDDFKRSSGKDDATLHFQIHKETEARELIAADHLSWQKLVAEAGPEGLARGHWIRRGPGLWEALKQLAPLRELKERLPAPLKDQLKPLKDELRAQAKLASARGKWVRSPHLRFSWWAPISSSDPWVELKVQVQPLKAQMPEELRKQLSPLKEELKKQVKSVSGRG